MARRKSAARPAPRAQKRPASTTSARPAPPTTTKPAQQANANVPAVPSKQPTALSEQRSPGLFGQMASTAAGVAVGHSIGHGITSLFSGGGGETPASQDPQTQYTPQTQNEQSQYQAFQNDSYGGASCEVDAKALTKCLELNNHNISLCQYYLENLKACQQMASQF